MGRSFFCLRQFPVRVRVRVRVRSGQKPISAAGERASSGNGEKKKQGVVLGRRIMVVVDSSKEAKAALQWALSHTVQSQDTIVLVDVVKPASKQEEKENEPRNYALLYDMRKFCQARRPEVEVEVSLVERKERGPAIVEAANRQGASLLVLGQKKRSMMWRLLMMWARGRNSGGGGVVDYCIQNASCMTLAVRRKSRRGGGYLITSRRHKDFWLLA